MSSSSTARAEARRRAILARGGDRLAKLTTTARGEDAPVFAEPRRESAAFVGEEPPSEPSVWSAEQQHHFMQALMNSGQSSPPQPTADDPLANMMAQLASMNPAQGTTVKVPVSPAPPTRLQTWLPLLHLVCMWSLLAVFVLWREPQVFVEKTAGAVEVAFWRRWPTLVTQSASGGAWSVQVVPFFWAFMTLQVMLHTLRIFAGHNQVQPPTLLSLALPHLPPPLPSLIMNGLRYFRMASVFLDDIAAILFGMGVIILITSWLVD